MRRVMKFRRGPRVRQNADRLLREDNAVSQNAKAFAAYRDSWLKYQCAYVLHLRVALQGVPFGRPAVLHKCGEDQRLEALFSYVGFGDEHPAVIERLQQQRPQQSLPWDRRPAGRTSRSCYSCAKAAKRFIIQFADRELTSPYFLVSLASLFAVRFTVLSPDIRLCFIFAAGIITNPRSRSSGRALKMVLWNSPSQLAGASRV